MAGNLQTIKDIRNYLKNELGNIYPEEEVVSLTGIVLMSVLKIDGIRALIDDQAPVLSPENTSRIKEICERLKTGEPLQYILGETIFHDCRIKVNPSVLIPRPETEELAELIINENKGFSGKLTDACTGSGCIAIALAVKFKEAGISGFDLSPEAISLAVENAELNNAKVSFYQADVFDIPACNINKVDIIVSNPPYVRNSEKRAMKRNVLGFEPHEALFVPDDDPLIFYKAILKLAGKMLTRGGKIYFEINEAMGRDTIGLLRSYNYTETAIYKDINGKDRIVKGYKNE
ncbi:MAG: peptide chain release factor N(5)-glutamine methyltransferase [Bacteroidales bacterium]|jgi:release factor glutamine methyltransferase|nr:peptide chain release factor N(5)-glutamine methyltransferase [Bacteroidales bacterium]